jgi:hypothetical protein
VVPSSLRAGGRNATSYDLQSRPASPDRRTLRCEAVGLSARTEPVWLLPQRRGREVLTSSAS